MRRAILLSVGVVVFVVGLSTVAAWAEVRSAVLRADEAGIYDFSGRVIRCEQGEPIGLWVEARRGLTLANVVIEGCEVGILVNAPGTEPGATAAAEPRVRVERVTVRTALVGIWLAGNGSTASENIVGECRYGFVVTGDENVLTRNHSNDNAMDGYLITGDRNILEGNEARGNGGVGIHVASMVPLVANGVPVLPLQDQGVSNRLEGNTALGNRLDLRDFTESCQELEPNNAWTGNQFETRRPECIE